MQLSLCVEVVEALEEFTHNNSDVLLAEDARFHLDGANVRYARTNYGVVMSYQVRARSSGAVPGADVENDGNNENLRWHVLHDNPEVRTLQERAMVFGDMRGIELGQNLDLLLNIFYFVFRTLEVNDLDCNSLLRALIISNHRVSVTKR